MSYIWKHPKSPYWTAVYRDDGGIWRKKTTKQKDRTKANVMAAEWERAASMGRDKILTEAVSREVLGGILERTTGDRLRVETLREFCKRWLTGKELSKHEGTATRYAATVEKLLGALKAKADLPIAAVTPADCQKFFDALVKQGLATATLVQEMQIVRGIFNQALRQTLITVNPGLAVELPTKIKQVKRKRFTPAQVQLLFDAADDAEWKTTLLFGYYGGLRLADAARRDWKEVDFTRRALVFDVAKTDEEDLTIPLHPDLEKHLLSLAGDHGGFICPKLAEMRVSGRRGLSRQFMEIMRKAGLSTESIQTDGKRQLAQLSFHSLRKSFNSELHNRGVSQEMRKKLTGHKSDEINNLYTDTELKTLRKAVDKLPRLKT